MTATRPQPGPTGAAGAPGSKGDPGAPGGSTHISQTYALMAGVATDGWYTADTAALDITDELDIVAWVYPDAWNPATNPMIMAKWDASGKRSYQFFLNSAGKLAFQFSTTGGDTIGLTCPVVFTPTVSGPIAVRCHAFSDVAGFATADFYWSDKDDYHLNVASAWTQIGTTVTIANVVGFANKTGRLYVGSNQAVSPSAWLGRIYKARLYHGDSTTTGTLVANFDATNLSSVAGFTDSVSIPWTPDATAAIASDPLTGNMLIGDNTIRATAVEGGGGIPAYVKRSYMMQDPTYGAVFDGVTETAAHMLAAQTALAADSIQPNGNLYTGRGIAMVGQGLVVKNKVTWIGEGRDGTVIKPHSTFPATKASNGGTVDSGTGRASITAGTSAVTLSSTADFSFTAGDVGRLICIVGAGAGGSMLVEKIASVTTTTSASINSRTTAGTTVTGAECYVCTPLIEIGDAGAFYCGLQGLHLWGQDFQGGSGLMIGCWTEFAQEQGFLDHVILTGFTLGAVHTPVTSGAEKNGSIRNCEILSGSGGPAAHSNADMMRVHGPCTIERNTVIGSNDFKAPSARCSIAVNALSGSVRDNHTEGSHTGLVIGENQRCIGLTVPGHSGHYNQTSGQIRIARPPSSENRGVAIIGPSIQATPTGTPQLIIDQDVNTVNYGAGAGIITGDTVGAYIRGGTGTTPTRIG